MLNLPPLRALTIPNFGTFQADLINNLVKTMKDHAVSTKAFLLDCLGSPLSDKEQLKSSVSTTNRFWTHLLLEVGHIEEPMSVCEIHRLYCRRPSVLPKLN